VRQHRYFLELKLDHDLRRLATTGRGVARLFGWLDPRELKYSLQYRGEGEGIYDYGPSEFSDLSDKMRAVRLDVPSVPAVGLSPRLDPEFVRRRVDRIRRIARQRHRFFLGYLDVVKGPVFVRVGRQILAWGETDIFRLLDNINPLDASFGGFFIPLDERRVPLDMVRANYHFGQVGPLSDTFLEGFAAQGNRVATFPGIPPGSPWQFGGLGFPNPAVRFAFDQPAREDIRGGARLVFTHRDVTYTLAHYYTYLDIPTVRFVVPKGLPGFEREIRAEVRHPRTPITGASLTFPLPAWYAVVRSEAAWFQGEGLNRQGRGRSRDALGVPGSAAFRRLRRENNIEGGLDPFVYPRFLDILGPTPRGRIEARALQRDSFNLALGVDVNRFVRWINAHQTIFVTTQFFYKHIFDSPGDLVLPVPYRNIPVDREIPIIGRPGCAGGTRGCKLRPRLFRVADDQFMHTFLVTTSYYGGRIVPSYGILYDWAGPLANQPGVTLVRDPFRVVFDYTRIDGPAASQIGLLRDRDNVRFQVEYVF
jgi:hypothetical protein